MHPRPQPPRREREQPAAGAYVEKRPSAQVADPKPRPEGSLCLRYPAIIQFFEKTRPVLSEAEAFPCRHFPSVSTLKPGLRLHVQDL